MNRLKTFNKILREIEMGVGRFQIDEKVAQLREIINKHSIRHSDAESKLLEIFLDSQFGCVRIPATIQRLRECLNETLPSELRVEALYMLARSTFNVEPFEVNCQYRSEALDIARKNSWTDLEFVILENWMFALLDQNLIERAIELKRILDQLQPNLSIKALTAPRLDRSISRYLAHQAQLFLIQARGLSDRNEIEDSVNKAILLFEKAINREKKNDHRRVNSQIEMAEHMIKSFNMIELPPLDKAASVLTEAGHSLDAHACDLCRGYYYEVHARYYFTRGNQVAPHQPKDALRYWEEGLSDCEKSIEYFERAGHTEVRVPKEIKSQLETKISMHKLPKKIFLSHSGSDKELVREFKKTLELLNFEPWLYDDEVTAGSPVERALLTGFQNSCAAVFFVTPSFIDEDYIQTEVDYAIFEKRQKGMSFSIITLVISDGSGDFGEVPKILKPYVWKQPKTHLEALRELIRALPLEVAFPNWKC